MIQNISESVQPVSGINEDIYKSSFSNFRYCFSCKSCATECPVNIFTGRLNPARLVRYASFGFKDELMRLPEIWYCLECGKCSNICPMCVKPHFLIIEMQNEAIINNIISYDIKRHIFDLFQQFQRIRLKLAQIYIEGNDVDEALLNDWDSDLFKDFSVYNKDKENVVILKRLQDRTDYENLATNIMSCLTCRECSNACPVCLENDVFDPLFLFRSFVFGLKDELLSMPHLWLCIECETCTKSCAQGVKGHVVIKHLRRMAIESENIDPLFLLKWNSSNRVLFNVLLDKIDMLIRKFSS